MRDQVMDNPSDRHNRYSRANDICRRTDYARWHRRQSGQQILRSQLGFTDTPSRRPSGCQNCLHYHGIAYGTSRDRATLICGFHPYGWQSSGDCPDWQAES
jgi:hypothetical protein